MRDIYSQHSDHFSCVSAYVIMRGGQRIATVAMKFPSDGAGRLYAYVHFIGMEMVRGFAGGYGYDKRTAAVKDAFRKMDPNSYFAPDEANGDPQKKMRSECNRFCRAILKAKDGQDWEQSLHDAGYRVFSAV